MNYDEIVEALKCCIGDGEDCDTCPYIIHGWECSYILMEDALALLREQHDSLGRLAKPSVEWIEIGKEIGRKEAEKCGGNI